jgi:hypothetical protein
MEKTSAEIGVEIDAKDKEISQAIREKEIVEQAIISLDRDILEKRIQKKELEMSLSKAHHIITQKKIERTSLNNAFWHAKNQGL